RKVHRIEAQHHVALLDRLRELPLLAVLVEQREIRGHLPGADRRVAGGQILVRHEFLPVAGAAQAPTDRFYAHAALRPRRRHFLPRSAVAPQARWRILSPDGANNATRATDGPGGWPRRTLSAGHGPRRRRGRPQRPPTPRRLRGRRFQV